jgi:acyl-CoA dehydrogenase
MSPVVVNKNPTFESVIDDELVTGLREFFGEQLGNSADRLEAGGRQAFEDMWRATDELDLPGIGLPEALGGAGGDLSQTLALAIAIGRHSVALPLLEHHVAGWLLTGAGVELAEGAVRTIVGFQDNDLCLKDGRLLGRAGGVPWAPYVDNVVALVPDEHDRHHVVEVPLAALEVTEGVDLAGQPRGAIAVAAKGTECTVRPSTLGPAGLNARWTLLTCAAIVGALETLSSMTVRYVQEREQFGQPIGRFQSVQLHVVTVEQAATSAGISLRRAAARYDENDAAAGSFEIDALRWICFEGAGTAARSAHQAHGAIGMTREFALHQVTRRLNSWRWDPENPAAPALRLGTSALRRGGMHRTVSAPPATHSTSGGAPSPTKEHEDV